MSGESQDTPLIPDPIPGSAKSVHADPVAVLGSKASESQEDPSADELAQQVLHYCLQVHAKIAAAESLTGGLLADAFVRIPGASKVFLGSAVTYDIRAKASILHVDRTLLETSGAVHPDVARQMAVGAASLYTQPQYGSRIFGLSTTGVAGPGPDGDKPAGLVYVGMAIPGELVDTGVDRVVVHRLQLQGSREHIRRMTVWHVVRFLTQFIEDSQE